MLTITIGQHSKHWRNKEAILACSARDGLVHEGPAHVVAARLHQAHSPLRPHLHPGRLLHTYHLNVLSSVLHLTPVFLYINNGILSQRQPTNDILVFLRPPASTLAHPVHHQYSIGRFQHLRSPLLLHEFDRLPSYGQAQHLHSESCLLLHLSKSPSKIRTISFLCCPRGRGAEGKVRFGSGGWKTWMLLM